MVYLGILLLSPKDKASLDNIMQMANCRMRGEEAHEKTVVIEITVPVTEV